jgi:hypothetical protein
MLDQFANAVGVDFFWTKHPRRIAQDWLSNISYLYPHLHSWS